MLIRGEGHPDKKYKLQCELISTYVTPSLFGWDYCMTCLPFRDVRGTKKDPCSFSNGKSSKMCGIAIS